MPESSGSLPCDDGTGWLQCPATRKHVQPQTHSNAHCSEPLNTDTINQKVDVLLKWGLPVFATSFKRNRIMCIIYLWFSLIVCILDMWFNILLIIWWFSVFWNRSRIMSTKQIRRCILDFNISHPSTHSCTHTHTHIYANILIPTYTHTHTHNAHTPFPSFIIRAESTLESFT